MPLRDYHDTFPAIVRRLCKTRRNNRVFHSWIVTGDMPSVLNPFVYSWIQTCICSQPTDIGDACGTCSPCKRIQKGTYLHLLELKPSSKSRQILVDQIRDLEHFLYLKTGGEKKVGLIFDADRMSIQAQNAFLKTLEEPVADTLLLLVTQNTNGLLPTIQSRCQTISLLKNRYKYEFKGCDDLVKVLAGMKQGRGAMVASVASDQITNILTRLQKEADLLGKKEYKKNLSSTLDDKGLKKKIEAIAQAQIASYYLSFRDQVISVIHAWYSQEFLRSQGIPIDMLPNPEFYETVSDEFRKNSPLPEEALHSVFLSEMLVENFSLNISEHLALQDFCYKVCAKN